MTVETETREIEMTKETKIPKERAEHVMSLRLTDSDWNLVVHVADALGVSISKAVRLMLRRADGGGAVANAAPVIAELRDDLDDTVRAFDLLSRLLDKQGVLLNQVVHKINAGAPVDAEAGEAFRACEQELVSTQWALRQKPGQIMSQLGLSVLLEEMDRWP